MMRAVAVGGYGEPPQVIDVPMPLVGREQILVRVAAASLNPFDAKIAAGQFRDVIPAVFPLTLGIDVAGTVVAVGEAVTRFVVGEDVCGAVFKAPAGSTGTLAEYVALSERAPLARAPAAMDLVTAAALPTAGGTALGSVDDAGELHRRTLLIVGATGGVGSFATQIAADRGARVIATARASAAERVLANGATETIDHTVSSIVSQLHDRFPAGIDAYLHFAADTSALGDIAGTVRAGGYVGSTTGGVDEVALRERGIRGVNLQIRQTRELQRRLMHLVDAGRLVVPAVRRITLDDAPAALGAIGTGHSDGKTVVVM
jgi:NADPH:quinone reductase-like Zn-dependent oxidoreductase